VRVSRQNAAGLLRSELPSFGTKIAELYHSSAIFFGELCILFMFCLVKRMEIITSSQPHYIFILFLSFFMNSFSENQRLILGEPINLGDQIIQ
jgi:hypothetical protein